MIWKRNIEPPSNVFQHILIKIFVQHTRKSAISFAAFFCVPGKSLIISCWNFGSKLTDLEIFLFVHFCTMWFVLLLCAPLWSFPQIHTSFISGEYIWYVFILCLRGLKLRSKLTGLYLVLFYAIAGDSCVALLRAIKVMFHCLIFHIVLHW